MVERPLKDFDTWNRSAKLVVSQKALESDFLSERLSMSLHIIAEDRDYASLTESLTEDLDKKHFELKDFAGMYQRERDIMKVARILFFGFATIIALISLANIYNSLISSLRFRKKEFAMLRSVGLDEASFRKMIRFESFFYAGKLLLYGIPLGVGMSYVIYRYLIRTVDFSFSIPVFQFIGASVVVVTALLLIMNLGSNSARRGSILDTLKIDMDV